MFILRNIHLTKTCYNVILRHLSNDSVPWFPIKIGDLDKFASHALASKEALGPKHPGYKDQEYQMRRNEFADIASKYKHGDPIPEVKYTDREVRTWGAVFHKLENLHPTHAIKEYKQMFSLMKENCGYKEDNIPQIIDVSNFLKDRTGFTLRPVGGYLPPRDLLAGLAFRVYHVAPYVRHHATPFYSPEPDVCHDLLGHAPLYGNPKFARFAQEFGLASLGASDEYIDKLAMCYRSTLEYGLCKQDGKLLAYGAGLLSSYGELKHCLSGKPEIREFNPSKLDMEKHPETDYQPVYYVVPSIESAHQRIRELALTIPRSFSAHYNPYTEKIEVVDTKPQVEVLARDIHFEMQLLADAITKI